MEGDPKLTMRIAAVIAMHIARRNDDERPSLDDIIAESERSVKKLMAETPND